MKFSVIIPVYNKANTLRHALESVFNQIEQDYEILVVDDGSTDSPETVLKEYESRPTLRFFHQKNSGVSVARNTGIQNARGNYICFLDADDLYHKNHLAVLSNLIEKYPEQSFFATSHMTVFPNHTQRDSSRTLKGYPENFLCKNLFSLLNHKGDGIIHTNCMCIKRSILIEENLFFQPGEKVGEDTDMWFRIALYHPIVISKAVTTSYQREHSTATAKTSNSLSWIFARRNLNEYVLSPEIKEECLRLIDRYKMTCSRDLLRERNRKGAFDTLRSVEYRGVKYYLVFILCCFPYKLSEWLLTRI